GVCFLPDCQDSDTVQGDINMNINEDSEYCENKGYTYYSSGQCPQYQAKVGTCSRDDHYLKCDPVKWCTDNGYNTQTCSLPSFVDGQCPNGKPYYKQCKEDRPRACRESGYVNSCSPGRLYATTNRCPYDKSFGKCCTASPSAGCPSDYAVTCDPARGSSGTDTCGYTCYRCCSDECSRGSKNYSGSYATTTECGSTCRYCKDCTSGSTSYSGSYAGSSECGSCYYCSDTCRSGQKSVSCSSTYNKVRVSSTECGTSCYECQYNTDCSVTSKSCTYGCASYNSCSKCTSCKSKPAITCSGSTPYEVNGACSECRTDSDCTANASTGLPYRYRSRCSTSLRKCVEALSVSDCKGIVAQKVGGNSGYKYSDSSTTYVSSGNCNCFSHVAITSSSSRINCHTHSAYQYCATKSCSTDADCGSWVCGTASTGGKWCVPSKQSDKCVY
ncbi:MAG: hypothetical protein J6L86_05390, partial [Alphaproteobacteria bacterium]|nr:hypothetical protein [Alphaproteobacteria bacterium]